MFKIIETVERGKKRLAIIPCHWEKNSILFWPRNKAEKYVNDPESRPQDNWLEIPCKLKRNHLLNLEVANEELERMLSKSDTETDEADKDVRATALRPRFKPLVHLSQIDSSFDFNSIAESCMPSIETEKVNLQVQTQVQSKSYQAAFSQTDEDLTKNAECKILENQNLIIQRIAKIETMIDQLAKLVLQKPDEPKQPLKKPENVHVCVEPFQPIKNKVELQKIEEILNEKEVFSQYLYSLRFICGKNRGRAVDNCYMLVDKFFTREFMTLCSWAGGSRQNGVEKIPFKIYKNIINLFFQTVHVSDSNFTMQECENFFKNVIKNASRRNTLASSSRQSKGKNRPRKLEYKAKLPLTNNLKTANSETGPLVENDLEDSSSASGISNNLENNTATLNTQPDFEVIDGNADELLQEVVLIHAPNNN